MIYSTIKTSPAEKSSKISFWFNGTEMGGGRTHKDPAKGFFFAAKGGYNDESHNHNDIGTFILYHEGQPLLVDIGVETYSSKTFSPKRYEIWTMQSDYHNVPVINGFSQAYGKKYKPSEVAFHNSNSKIQMSLNLAGAYPEEALCSFWKRTYTLKRTLQPQLIINEEYSLKEIKGKSEEHFLTTQLPKVEKDGEIKLKEKGRKSIYLIYPPDTFEVKTEELPLIDKRLLNSWKQDKLYRVILINKKILKTQRYSIQIIEKLNKL